ncbi:MAG: hypothetical protein INF13_13650 [Methylobacterium sp.]|nr:hypothetical protein [Methylobacterium sp.]
MNGKFLVIFRDGCGIAEIVHHRGAGMPPPLLGEIRAHVQPFQPHGRSAGIPVAAAGRRDHVRVEGERFSKRITTLAELDGA